MKSFDGNMQDRRSLDKMLDALESAPGKRPGATVIVDRGMALMKIWNRSASVAALSGRWTTTREKPVARRAGK